MSSKKQSHPFLKNVRFYQVEPPGSASARQLTTVDNYYDESSAICREPTAAHNLSQPTDSFTTQVVELAPPLGVNARRFEPQAQSSFTHGVDPREFRPDTLGGFDFPGARYQPGIVQVRGSAPIIIARSDKAVEEEIVERSRTPEENKADACLAPQEPSLTIEEPPLSSPINLRPASSPSQLRTWEAQLNSLDKENTVLYSAQVTTSDLSSLEGNRRVQVSIQIGHRAIAFVATKQGNDWNYHNAYLMNDEGVVQLSFAENQCSIEEQNHLTLTRRSLAKNTEVLLKLPRLEIKNLLEHEQLSLLKENIRPLQTSERFLREAGLELSPIKDLTSSSLTESPPEKSSQTKYEKIDYKTVTGIQRAKQLIQEELGISPLLLHWVEKKGNHHPDGIDIGYAQERIPIPGHPGRFIATFRMGDLVLTSEYEAKSGVWQFIENSPHNRLQYFNETSGIQDIAPLHVSEIGGRRYFASTGAAQGMLFYYKTDGHLYLLTPETERDISNSLGYKSVAANSHERDRFSTVLPAQQALIRARIEENQEKYPEYFSQDLLCQSATLTLEEIVQRLEMGQEISSSKPHSLAAKLAQRQKVARDFFFDLEKGTYTQTLQLVPTKGEDGFYISMNQYYRVRYKNPKNPTEIHVEYRTSSAEAWFPVPHSEIQNLGDGQVYLTLGYPLNKITFVIETNSEKEPSKPRNFREVSDVAYREGIETRLGILEHPRLRLSAQARSERKNISRIYLNLWDETHREQQFKIGIFELIQRHLHEPDALSDLLFSRAYSARNQHPAFAEMINLSLQDPILLSSPQFRNELITHIALHYAKSAYAAEGNARFHAAMTEFFHQRLLEGEVRIQRLHKENTILHGALKKEWEIFKDPFETLRRRGL